MKTRFLNIINTAAATAITTLEGVVNDLRLDGDGGETWQRLVEYGEYPAEAVVNGRKIEVMQVLDRQAGDLMVQNHATVVNAIRHLGRGLPVYIGHPDDKDWLKENPGADESAKGRIKKLEAREDGVWMLTVFNDDGRRLVGGEAPSYSAQSPNWDLTPVSPGSKRYRPYVLRSIGLTNKPNISSCVVGLNTAGGRDPNNSQSDEANASDEAETTNATNDETMNEELLKRLGLKPGATQSEIDAAVAGMLGKHDTATADLATAGSNLTAANTRADGLQTELDTLRGSLATNAINTAVTDGRITEADRPMWEGLLKADPINGAAALSKVGKITTLNTSDKIGDMGVRKGEGAAASGGITAINEAVSAYGHEQGLDLKNAADYDRAFAAVKAAKPELFAKA